MPTSPGQTIYIIEEHESLGLNVNKEILISMYRKMIEIRRFEEKVAELYSLGTIHGLAHPYIGQEAVAVGVCSALRDDDYVLSVHRGHGHSIAKGVPLGPLMAELFGKDTGVCRGIGGSMHSTYLEKGVLFSTAIVGGNIPIAAGVALAIKLNREDRVVACFFGDGATNTGAFHEALNLIAVWKLPVLLICENNLYAVSTSVKTSVAAKEIADRGIAYNLSKNVVDGMNVLAVHGAAIKAIAKIREGSGAMLLECQTYRFRGHGMYDLGTQYRTKEEVDEWLKRCPITNLRYKLLKENLVGELELTMLEEEVRASIEEAVRFAEESAYPSRELMEKVFYS